jgi:hypothetical protein
MVDQVIGQILLLKTIKIWTKTKCILSPHTIKTLLKNYRAVWAWQFKTVISATQKAETGGLQVQGQSGQSKGDFISKNTKAMGMAEEIDCPAWQAKGPLLS